MTERTTYKVTLADGQRFVFRANLTEAKAPISVNFHNPRDEDDWQSTPYQTADARHCEMRAAKLLAEHYAEGDDDCTDVDAVIAIATA